MFLSGGAASTRGWLQARARDPRAWLVLIAFLLRLLWVLLVPSRPVGDFALYREAAEYLQDQGHLDAEFVYMPGYVMLLAGVRALGGGLLAAKMVGVLAGTIVVFAAGGIAGALFGRRAGIVATALAAVWPAGIAVASVTGTDVPAAALGTLAIHALVRLGPRRPWRAAVACGLLLGLTAWVRAVAAPLAALSLFYWLALSPRALGAGLRWRIAGARAATALAIAFIVLLPWALRNRAVYGRLLFTDSHGGNTALVGANPNSEGTYSRSLNLMFTKGTGYRLFEPPGRHLAADQAAYALAKQWTAFEPLYAAGLIFAKADRLLTHERNLLYWPLFRQGVLDDAHRAVFSAHQTALERTADIFWWGLAALTAAGLTICAAPRVRRAQRLQVALALMVFPVALIGIYTLFFAEVRYHLAIVPLLFPYAACAVDWLWSWARTRFREDRGTLFWAGASVVVLFVGWPGLMTAGAILRAHHRWAVTVCTYPDAATTHLCPWRRGLPAHGDSPVRGSWDAVGLHIDHRFSEGVLASARTSIPVDQGRYHVRALVTLPRGAASTQAGLAVALRVDGRVIARAVSPPPWNQTRTVPVVTDGVPRDAIAEDTLGLPLAGVVEVTRREPLIVEAEVEPADIRSSVDGGGTVWMSQLIVERF